MNEHWNIKSRSLTCCETGHEFTEGEDFYTALLEDPESEGFLRKDFSEEAWNKVGASLEPFSFWRSKFEPPPPVEDKEVVKKENAESLLRRLIEENDKKTENARYILAVMLERKRILVQVDVKPVRSGGRHLVYERCKTGEAFIVKDPQLKLEEIESVQEEVGALLGGAENPLQEKKEEAQPARLDDTAEKKPDVEPAASP